MTAVSDQNDTVIKQTTHTLRQVWVYAVLRIPSGSSEQGRMVDALTEEGDEGRGIAAICFGEVLSNL
jgi:hypothetical protein